MTGKVLHPLHPPPLNRLPLQLPILRPYPLLVSTTSLAHPHLPRRPFLSLRNLPRSPSLKTYILSIYREIRWSRRFCRRIEY
jgi:hypothetical protein